MLKGFLKSLLLHIVFALLFVFAYLSPSAIKKPHKKPIAISFSVPSPTKEQTTIKKTTDEKPIHKELPVKVQPTPAEEKPQDAKPKKIAPEKSAQAQAKPQTTPSEVIKQATSIPSVPNTLPLYTQAPVQPSMPSSPMQKTAQPQPEAVPTLKKPAQVQHTAIQATTPIAAIAAVNQQPLHAVVPAQPSMSSLPMQKPIQHQAEQAPSMATSTIPEAIVAPKSMPNTIANSMITPPAPPSFIPPTQSLANPPSARANPPAADETNNAKQEYLRSIAEQIKKYKTYPKEAKENNNIMGKVKIIFRINADGSILKIAIVDSSGSKILDKAAVDLILSITKFQALPTILGKEYMDITLDIDYTLK